MRMRRGLGRYTRSGVISGLQPYVLFHLGLISARACTWQPDGTSLVYDLGPFESAARTATQTVKVVTLEGGIVYFDLCAPVKVPNECSSEAGPGAHAFKTVNTPKGAQCFPLGQDSERKWSLLDAAQPADGFRLEFAGVAPFKAERVFLHSFRRPPRTGPQMPGGLVSENI